MNNQEILENAPVGATHYTDKNPSFNLYFKLIHLKGMEVHIAGKWEPYPPHGDLLSLSCLRENLKLHEEMTRIVELEKENDKLKNHGEAVADALGFKSGNVNRLRTSVIETNIKNIKSFSDCLDEVERGYFMVETECDDEDESSIECLLNKWAWTPEEYAKKFGMELNNIRADAIEEALHSLDANSSLISPRTGRQYLQHYADKLRKGDV